MEYIDLGLPSRTLWADCNVGAEKPEDYGYYHNFNDVQQYGLVPTYKQIVELSQYTEHKACVIHNIRGMQFIGQNNNGIFIPFAGSFDDIGIYFVGFVGRLWSCTSDGDCVCQLYFARDGEVSPIHNYFRNYNSSVRLIKNK